MINVLGIDTQIFDQVSPLEKNAYRMATNVFLVVLGISLLANGYMGLMLYSSWIAALVFALIFGCIHFSILRIALITLLSKPLAAEEIAPVATLSQPSAMITRWNALKKMTNRLRLSSLFRVLFVGLIALTISFPFCSLLMLPKTLAIEESHRLELIQANADNKFALNEIKQTHFPFHVFKELLPETGFEILLCISVCLVFAPLVLVARLRYHSKFEYLEKARQEMLKLVAIDYDETLEQCQYSLNRDFPSNRKELKELSIYADAPINSVYKNETKHAIGNKAAFNQFIQSIE
jgi:hypothetical protein